jgi:hypothetical protein
MRDDAARVRTLEFDSAFDSFSNERDAGMMHHLFLTPIFAETLHIKGSYPKPITSSAKV